MELTKRRILLNAFFKAQFNYRSAIWMFHSRTVIYNDKLQNFQEHLHQDNSVSIHHNNIHALAIEMYKFVNGNNE